MAKVFVFSGPDEFTEFVRLNRSTRDGGTRELITVTGDQIPGGSALILNGFSPRGLAGVVSSFARKEAAIDGERVRWKDGGRTLEGRIGSRRSAASLTDFVSLISDPDPPSGGLLHFLVREQEPLSKLVRDSLRLGNDRMHFAVLPEAALVRIDRPSFFLLQELHENGGATVFREVVPGLLVRWGWRHPLEALWNPPAAEPAEWRFLTPDAEPFRTPVSAWQDIYDLLAPEPDLPVAEWKTGTTAAPGRIRVPLRLAPGPSSAEPELWILDRDGLDRMEPLLAVLDQDDVMPYQVSIRSDDSGRDRIFVREKSARGGRRHLEFSGLGMAPFAGLNNLFLPVGWTLLPPLRRHVYRDLFRLQPENLTLIVPGENGGLTVLELPERSFTSLTSLIDYVVDSGASVLTERMESSLFDLGPWEAAPSHSGLARPAGAEVPKPAAAAVPAAPAATPVVLPEEEVKSTDPSAFLRTDHRLDESALDALHRRELDLERAVIQCQTLSAWQELLRLKLTLGKADDAMHCAVEALWLTEGPAPELEAALDGLTTAAFPAVDDALSCPPVSQRSCLAAFRLRSTAPSASAPAAESEPWIRALHQFLTAHHETLRVKERWLAWGAVLRLNRDLRREVQLRDEIRAAISERGLSLENTPPFIRTRLFLDRSTDPEAGTSTDSGSAAERAAAHLLALEASASACRVPGLTEVWRGLLGRGMARVGDHPAAARLAAGLGRSPDPWTALFVSQTVPFINPPQAGAAAGHLNHLLASADKSAAALLHDAREAWAVREKMDNPAAFLAQESRDRTYPKGGAVERGTMMELKARVDAAGRASEEHLAAGLMQQMMALPEARDYDDPVKLPQFIESLVSGLERFRWGLRGAGLLPQFMAFAPRVPGFIKKPDPFYGVVLRANLAAGLLACNDPAGAAAQVAKAVELLSGNMGELDFIDACAAAMRAIEQLPLERRLPLLTAAAGALFARFPAADSHFFTRPRLYAALVRCAEQIVEAAISRDRLSLELFRNYQLQDEFLILQRLQHESFARP